MIAPLAMEFLDWLAGVVARDFVHCCNMLGYDGPKSQLKTYRTVLVEQGQCKGFLVVDLV